MRRNEKTRNQSLVDSFISAARENWSNRCISDSRKDLNYGQTLTAALALGKKLERMTIGCDKIAILLPPSVGGVLANIAVNLIGKITVNLNYTLSAQTRDAAVSQCDIKHIITSKLFLKKANIEIDHRGIIFIEDSIGRIKPLDKLKAYLTARFVPQRFIAKKKNDIATIIFSSGTTGTPKGVMLSHYNIISNTDSIRKAIYLTRQDNLCAVLPFFHSFGFTCGLWLPIIIGASAVYCANPFDAMEVGKNCRKHSSTILFAPPTFLLNYIRRIEKSDFATLRLVAAGAEKLKKIVAEEFENKFGIHPVEGYGMTELSPVVSLNLPDANKHGSVGRALPDVEIKIVDIETCCELKPNERGLVMVKGANVMAGYFNMPERTAEVVKDGWYNTGDIGFLDENGFLTITARLSRFSKIAGEMVPHVGVEEAFHNALGVSEQMVVVTAVPDDKKGEELVVLHLPQAGDSDKLHELISKSPLPNLWKPKKNNYIPIESIPTLGSGKLDIAKLRNIALKAKSSIAE